MQRHPKTPISTIQHLSVEAELMQDTAQDYLDAALEACR
jgi:hypothetical protein